MAGHRFAATFPRRAARASIDERRRPFALSPVLPLVPDPPATVDRQDLQEVWFAGVHSDVGGMFEKGARPVGRAVKADGPRGVRPRARAGRGRHAYMSQVIDDCATGAIDVMSPWWDVLGRHRRHVQPRAAARQRAAAHSHDPAYRRRAEIPEDVTFLDDGWLPSSTIGAATVPDR